MPLQRRLPKVGFRSRKVATRAEVRLHELAKIEGGVVSLDILKQARLVPSQTKQAKVIVSGTLDKALTLQGILVTKGARQAIEAAGGTIED